MNTAEQQDSFDINNIPNQQLEEIKNISLDLIKGVPLYKHQNITKQNLDAMASIALRSYSSGQYENAIKIYKLLCLLDHTNSNFFLGIGTCHQMLNNLGLAIESYLTAIMLKETSYNSYFNLAQCMLKIGNSTVAIEALDKILEIAEKDAKIKKTPIYKKTILMLTGLKENK